MNFLYLKSLKLSSVRLTWSVLNCCMVTIHALRDELLCIFPGNCFLLKMHHAPFLCSFGNLSPKNLWMVKLTSVVDMVNGLFKKGGSEGNPSQHFFLCIVFSLIMYVTNNKSPPPYWSSFIVCLLVFFLRKTGKDGQFGKKTIINVKMKIVLQNVPKQQPIV